MKRILLLFLLSSLVGTDSFSQSRLSVDLLRTHFKEDSQNTETFQMDDDLGLRVSYSFDFSLTERLNLETQLGYNLLSSGYSGPYLGTEYFAELGCRIDGADFGINLGYSVKKFQIISGLTTFIPVRTLGVFGESPGLRFEQIEVKPVWILLDLEVRFQLSKRFILGGKMRYCPHNIVNESVLVSEIYYVDVRTMTYRDQGISLYYFIGKSN